MSNIDDKLDEILSKHWCMLTGQHPIYEHMTTEEAKQAIQQLITEASEQAVADYQTKYEQKHLASAIRLAKIDEEDA